MTKSRAIQWLEQQTGQSLDEKPGDADDTRHLSVRVPALLFERIEDLANSTGETVSQVARRLLDRGVTNLERPDRDAIDRAIATLERVRSELPTTAA